MTFTDLSHFCRLCLMPLNGSYVDCAIDDNCELKDTIKMVYNIDIQTNDEYSTKVCLMCCDILLCNAIHFVRALEAQKSLTRIQRIKNKLRNFGKKKITDKKEPKQQRPVPAETTMIVDVEMIEIEPNTTKTALMECCEMDEAAEDSHSVSMNATSVGPCTEPNQQRLFGHLTSFNQQQNHNPWSATGEYDVWNDKYSEDDNFDIADCLIIPPPKFDIDQNNNTKQTPSFFQMAKRFCDSMKNSVDRGMDEITKQLALLRFTPC